MKLATRIIFALCLPLFLFTASIAIVANSGWLYQHEFAKHNVAERTGLNSEELAYVAGEFVHYFNSSDEVLDIVIVRDGEPVHLFNQREIDHMKEVKPLIRLDYQVLAGCGLYVLGYALWGAFSAKGQNRRELAQASRWGGGATLVLIALVGLSAALSFDWFFTQLHLVFFGDTTSWIFPPEDYLIRLFPEGFFFDMALICTGMAALLGAAILAGGLIYGRMDSSQ